MNQRDVVQRKFRSLAPALTERSRRLWAGCEAEAIGYGGVALVAAATGMAISTVRKGRDELRRTGPAENLVKERRRGAGRHSLEKKHPELVESLHRLVAPLTRGDPESSLRWMDVADRGADRQRSQLDPIL